MLWMVTSTRAPRPRVGMMMSTCGFVMDGSLGNPPSGRPRANAHDRKMNIEEMSRGALAAHCGMTGQRRGNEALTNAESIGSTAHAGDAALVAIRGKEATA